MGANQSSGKTIVRSQSTSGSSGYFSSNGRVGRVNQVQNQCNSYDCQQCSRMTFIANQTSSTIRYNNLNKDQQQQIESNGCKSCLANRTNNTTKENQYHPINFSPTKSTSSSKSQQQNICCTTTTTTTTNTTNNNTNSNRQSSKENNKMRYKSPQQQYQYHNNSNNDDNNNIASLYNSNTVGRTKLHHQNSGYETPKSSCVGSLKRIKSSPLTAQQASYEAMRTIDMYLIRQIARNFLDFDLEQKIDNEIRIREGTTALLANAKHELQQLEIEKSLLTSDQRMNCYATDLQQRRLLVSEKKKLQEQQQQQDANQRQHGTASPKHNNRRPFSQNALSPSNSGKANIKNNVTVKQDHQMSPNGKYISNNNINNNGTTNTPITSSLVIDSKSSVTVSDIRIPLMWRDVDHFKNRGEYKRYAIFCLVRIDSQIYDTQLIGNVDRQVTDVTFDDFAITFNDIPHNFELKLEIYSCVYMEEFSIASTPRKLKRKLTNSVSRAMGRRMATASASYTRELQAYDKSYRFDLIASATLQLEDASDSIKTYDLMIVNGSNNGQNMSSPSYHHVGTSSANLFNTAQSNKNNIPLFGHFCCRLEVKPDCLDKIVRTGYLKVLTVNQSSQQQSHRESSVSAKAQALKMSTLSMSSAVLYWGMLRNFQLQLWPINERISPVLKGELIMPALDFKPHIIVPVDLSTQILRASNSTLTLDTSLGCFIISANHGLEYGQAVIELTSWLRSIEQQIHDSRLWYHVTHHYLMSPSDYNNDNNNVVYNTTRTLSHCDKRVDNVSSSKIYVSSTRKSSSSSNSGNSDSWNCHKYITNDKYQSGNMATSLQTSNHQYPYINNVKIGEDPRHTSYNSKNHNKSYLIDSDGGSRKLTPTDSDIDDGYATTIWPKHGNRNSQFIYEQTGL